MVGRFAEITGMALARHSPPAPVLVIILALVLLVPLWSWTMINMREWGFGGSPADMLSAPYFWGVLWLRLGGAFLLAIILWLYRRPASIWIALTSVWLAGPPLQMLLMGVEILAASEGQRSLPSDPLRILIWWSIGPSIMTIFLLAFRSSRRAYGLDTQP